MEFQKTGGLFVFNYFFVSNLSLGYVFSKPTVWQDKIIFHFSDFFVYCKADFRAKKMTETFNNTTFTIKKYSFCIKNANKL